MLTNFLENAGEIIHTNPWLAFLVVFIGGLMTAGGLALGTRFLYYYFNGMGEGKIQSLILTAILLIVGFQTCMIGLVADLINFNRRILEETLYRVRRVELVSPRAYERSEVER